LTFSDARVETIREVGISQPRQKPWAYQWGIRSGSGEAREPIERRGRAGQEGQGQQESEGKKQPFSGSLGSRQACHRIHVGCGEEDRERNGGEQWTERNKGNGRGRVGALKRAECGQWPSQD
jgi:hypothetical protein